MDGLQLRLLGAPRGEVGGAALNWRTRKVLALLAYLALEPGPHSRDRLAGLLWPDSEPEAARNSLRTALVALRQDLGERVLADRSRVELRLEAGDRLDAALLQQAAERAARGTANPAELEAFVADDELLEGLSLPEGGEFEDWLAARREQARGWRDAILDRLTTTRLQDGQAALAEEAAGRWFAQDHLNERAARRLMEARLVLGNRSGALSAFEALREALAAQLGEAPEPETAALAERARRNEWTSAAPTASGGTPIPERLVGRSEEYRRLVRAFHEVAGGDARAVVLTGEPGIGKTRLARHFLSWAAAQGSEVLRARAYETGGSLPYTPLAADLSPRLAREDAGGLLSPVWLAELSRLVPDLPERLPDLPAPLGDEATARTRLFEAVTRLGTGLVREYPLVFFLDDLHWADEGSLDLVGFAARRWAEEGKPVLILATARSDSLTAAGNLDAWLTALGRDLPVERLALGALSAEETGAFLDGLHADPEEARRLTAWLYRETGGQPLYIAETVKSLAERGLLRSVPGGSWRVDLPAVEGEPAAATGVQAVIRARLARLGRPATEIIRAAAVLGQGFDFELLREVSALEEADALDALDEVLASGMLVESGGRYSFSHDRVREVAYDEAGGARHRVLHRRALAALASRSAPAAVLALHAQAAGDETALLRHGLDAGLEAAWLGARRQAIDLLEPLRSRLREMRAAQVAHLSDDDLRHLYGQLAQAYENLGRAEEAHATYLDALDAARRWTRHRLVAAALTWLASEMVAGNRDLEAAAAYLDEAEGIARREGDRKRLLRIEEARARLTGRRQGVEAQVAALERVATTAQSEGWRDYLQVLTHLGAARHALGRYEEAYLTWRQATDGIDIGNAAQRAFVIENLGITALNAGHPAKALAALRESNSLKKAYDENPSFVAVGGAFLTHALLEAGSLQEALEVADESREAVTATDPRFIVECAIARGLARLAFGRYQEGRSDLLEALAVAESQRGASGWAGKLAAHCHSWLCAAHAESGRWEEAREHAHQAVTERIREDDERGFHSPRQPLWAETEALLRGSEEELAREATSRLERVVGDSPRLRLAHLRSLAVLARHAGDGAALQARLEEAFSLAGEIGLPVERWRIAADLAASLAASGWAAQAATIREEGAEILRSLAERITDKALREEFLARASGVAESA